MRKIVHVDMDAFFASIEQRDNAKYRGKPLAVGYSGSRGVVAAASYEARKFGVHSAMSSKLAKIKCPDLIFVPTRFSVYREVSRQIRNIFLEYTDLVEPLALDEAFLDVTQNHKGMLYAMDIAKEIKEKIKRETELTASAGISYNKFLAKIASDYHKPDGLFVITPKRAEKFIEQLKIEKFFGVGKRTAEKMHQSEIYTGFDLKQKSKEELINLFGKRGEDYFFYARGIDNRRVNPSRIRKSVGSENTFMEDTDSFDKLSEELEYVAQDVMQRIEKNNFRGRTISLKIKYADFRIISRSKTLLEVVERNETLLDAALELLKEIDLRQKVRLIGLSIKNADIKEEKKTEKEIQLKIPFKEFE